MDIRPITSEEYGGREFRYRYISRGYYDIERTDGGFSMQLRLFQEPEIVDDPAYMLEDWMEEPAAFGAFDGESLIGFTDGYHEKWNNRFQIANLHIFDDAYRGRGLGSALLAEMEKAAARCGARAIALETQNGNEIAIAFYRKHGFEVIGFDMYFYSDTDPEKHNIRMLLSKKL